jgi:hypothetical protein
VTTIVDVEVQLGLTPEVVRRVLRRHLRELGYCYSEYFDGDASEPVLVRMAWDVSPEGRVPRSRLVDGTHAHTALESCMLSALRRWSFPEPRPSAEVQATATVRFSPGEAAADSP